MANVEHMLRAGRRAKSAITDACHMIKASRMLTVTMRGGAPSTTILAELVSKFYKRVEGTSHPLKGLIVVFEYCNSEGEPFIHAHCPFHSTGYEPWGLWQEIWRDVIHQHLPETLGDKDPGNLDVKRFADGSITKSTKAIAGYICKYISKGIAVNGDLNEKRYRLIDCGKPEITRFTLPRNLFGLDLADDISTVLGTITNKPVNEPWYGTAAGLSLTQVDTLSDIADTIPGEAQAGAVGAPRLTGSPHEPPLAHHPLVMHLRHLAAAGNAVVFTPDTSNRHTVGCTCGLCNGARPHTRKTKNPGTYDGTGVSFDNTVMTALVTPSKAPDLSKYEVRKKLTPH